MVCKKARLAGRETLVSLWAHRDEVLEAVDGDAILEEVPELRHRLPGNHPAAAQQPVAANSRHRFWRLHPVK